MSPPIASPIASKAVEAPPIASTPVCTLTQAEADARAGAALAIYSQGRGVLPPGFSAQVPCESHCIARGGRPSAGVPCDSWECPFRYGPPGQRTLQTAEVTVHVIRCGAQVFTTERLADCFARPHGCRVIVDRSTAWDIAEKRGSFGGSFGPWLRWIPSAGEFQWVVYMDDDSQLRISAHEKNKLWTGEAPPMTPYGREPRPR